MGAIKLTLEEGFREGKGWNRTLMRMLADSGLFQVTCQPRLEAKTPHRRRENFSVFQVGERWIGLDTWDTAEPSVSWLRAGEFHGGTFAHLDLLVKIQMANTPRWRRMAGEFPIPISPWIIFPNREFPLGYFQWEEGGHSYLASFTGQHQNRFSRPAWIRFIEAEMAFINTERNVSFARWLDLNQQCTWGLILHGLKGGGDAKNRREIEYASCGMPLALNYRPNYPFAMEPGRHYLYLETPRDIRKLAETDPRPFAAESRKLYADYFSPLGAAQLLLRLVQQRCR
jgi:hypothetical protein